MLCTDCRVPKYELLDLGKIYTVVMPSYIVDGGDGFDMIKKGLLRHNTGRWYSLEEMAVANHKPKIQCPIFLHAVVAVQVSCGYLFSYTCYNPAEKAKTNF